MLPVGSSPVLDQDPMELPPEDFPPQEFPSEIADRAGDLIVSYEYSPEGGTDMGLDVSWGVITRSLYFSWGATPEGPGAHGLAVGAQYVLPFWPTAIAGSSFEKGTVYVAGWTERGRTRILKLSLSPPSLSFDSSSTGETSYSLIAGSVQSVREIYDAPTGEVGFISNLLVNRKESGQLFVHKFPGGQVDRLDLASGVRTALITSAATGAPFTGVPLQSPYVWAGTTENTTHGYAYVCDQIGEPLAEGVARILVYMDSDKDGLIDSAQVLTAQQYRALGLDDEAQVVSWD